MDFLPDDGEDSRRESGAFDDEEKPLDRLTHHVHILEMNGESYRFRQSKSRRREDLPTSDEPTADPDTGEFTPE